MDLEDLLSKPSEADIQAVLKLDRDLLILGAGGKMGPSLITRIRRAADIAGKQLRIIAVARSLQTPDADVIPAELTNRRQVEALPDAPHVIYMVGRKFGSTGNEPLTWAVNAWIPGLIAERYTGSKIVAFSTGNVYPFVPVDSGGATESTRPNPVGEYAQSALARERMFEYFSDTRGTPTAILRLNYAIDLRYGVLLDIGQKVFERRPIDLTMGHVNVIWQGDANSVCLRAFDLCSSPARILNLTGPETLSVRWIAERFGSFFRIEPILEGGESPTALLSNASECARLFGPYTYRPEEMVLMTAQWIGAGGHTYNKPTHFEVRHGAY